MKDNFGREIDYMRISITDRCNLRCKYCMPENGIETFPMSEILSYEEIVKVCERAAGLGIKKIRLTGGEPLVRINAPALVGMIQRIKDIEEVDITTNGVLLKENLDALIASGVNCINISLDTLNPKRYEELTGKACIEEVLSSIDACLEAGIKVKINSVLLDGEDYKEMYLLAKNKNLDVRFIELMPLGIAENLRGVDYREVVDYIKNAHSGSEWDDIKLGNGPARYLKIPGFTGRVGFISPIHGKFCDSCNRIRMTATGQIKSCLCYKDSKDIKGPLRENNIDEVDRLLKEAILGKPKAHAFEEPSLISEDKRMVSIGG